jgi:hypothetical protein
LSEESKDTVSELLAQSLAAWRITGTVDRAESDAILLRGVRHVRIERAGPEAPFRWMVTVDGRKRGAVSLVAVLRQVRTALDPGYATSQVRVAVAPLVPW